MTAETTAFDVCGPLPQPGITVLEASAGTGKTFTIAALAARYVAEGRPLKELLLVTFTRMATGELRERVRERLVQTEHGLDRALRGEEQEDRIVALLANGSREEVEQRRLYLAKAVADFDAATIVTTHGFCQEVLGSLGIAGDVETDYEFLEDTRDLIDEVVDDLYVRRFHRASDDDIHIKRAQAREIARLAINNPAATIVPEPAEATPRAAMRSRLAEAAREEFKRRTTRAALMTYDELLTHLRDALKRDGGEAIAETLRSRYRVVLVDEFQDTDPVQWEIMDRAFGGGGATLVLIGDPKQAIYAFRGADVYAYIEAAKQTESRPTLERNFRSDQGLLDAYDRLLANARLGHEDIVYREVAADHETARLQGAPDPAPLRVRIVHRDDPKLQTVGNGQFLQVDSAREHVAQDVAADLVELLNSDATIEGKQVCPGHVAVLVRTNKAAALIRDELDHVGIPAVINGAGSVFGTAEAREWLQLLRAIERPTSTPRARAAALTAFLGWSTTGVADGTDDEWEQVHQRLHRWARVLRVKGVAALMEEITLTERLPERVLKHAGGERRLTDLRHIGQLLHAAARSEHLGGTALTGWLRRRIAEAEQDTADEERSRRLESDAEAVQVLTIHRSKGLEFPIVYLPYLWDPTHVPRNPVPVTFHDPENDDRRTIDVGLEGRTYNDHRRQHIVEERGEDLRLAYVALTRAKHQAVVWWAASKASKDSSLSRLMFDRDEEGNVASNGTGTPSDAEATAAFEELAATAPGRISVARSELPPPRKWAPPRTPTADLTAADFLRDIDWRWRRTSFSDITAGAHDDARVTSEPEEPLVVDELEVEETVSAAGADAPEVPLAKMPAGVQIGTFVHEVFEAIDFAAADLEAEVAQHVAIGRARRGVDIGDADTVVAGLAAAIRTPLAHGGIALNDIQRSDRLDELQFELPLVGGDTPTGAKLTLDAIARTLREHLAPDDPLVGYPALLNDPALRHSVRGFLTGSIDLVLRTGDTYAVVDYKTNWLGDTTLTPWHYRPEALIETMQRSHYALQALLYTVALHRFLRWRLTGYDPGRHLGGVLYLFVRGMVGDPGGGVFSWRPPAALVTALSDLFEEGTT